MARHKRISIHALREEGDGLLGGAFIAVVVFLSTPSARRATEVGPKVGPEDKISIHALREEGDEYDIAITSGENVFLSTPSARRATTTKTS